MLHTTAINYSVLAVFKAPHSSDLLWKYISGPIISIDSDFSVFNILLFIAFNFNLLTIFKSILSLFVNLYAFGFSVLTN